MPGFRRMKPWPSIARVASSSNAGSLRSSWQPLDQHAPDVGCAEHGRRAAKRSPPAPAALHLSAERFVSISVSMWGWRLSKPVDYSAGAVCAGRSSAGL